ncbi:magnesium chelatase subunit D [Austwickia chelonae]|uniref:Mg-protoporphyrin IX chelatase n=1 Tax=Austwickia chelonae NBRC 105200 TaxID=1184607 RepID=K6V6P7_9MICO|nr:VWA domain-containing protein [Austwickia chelonae]GAB77903.1 putative magnesium chelatase [Austwickia chelonae NBRC 105200]SEV91888.1 magnesium chelatase subunit D [Austwickia chelonae]
MTTYPFAAVVGADDMTLALTLCAISPEIGGVLVRGEKGTAKSTAVRGLAALLPDQQVITGCRFACDPSAPDLHCPDGPHPTHPGPDAIDRVSTRPARLVELPVGATEDRVLGSLDLEQALGEGRTAFEPGLLAAAHRGILYVDEVNLLHDHLVDLLLDAAAMGRCTVEREGVSLSHAARLMLIGTMNPEEGELRPQLLDRFGLTAEVSAPRDPAVRVEVVRRRMAFDSDPDLFTDRYAADQADLRHRIAAAQEAVARVHLGDDALLTIARVCSGFEVDGMRADLVTARAAIAHAAWAGRSAVTREDIRAAARLALPHRRRRNPFDAPGLDEDLLEQLLGPDEPDDPQDDPDGSGPHSPQDDPEQAGAEQATDDDRPASAAPSSGDGPQGTDASHRADPRPEQAGPAVEHPDEAAIPPAGRPAGDAPAQGTAVPDAPFRARLVTARGIGRGAAGKRSRALTGIGKVIGVAPGSGGQNRQAPGVGGVHLPATIRAAAPHQPRRGRSEGDALVLHREDVRRSRTEGRESNLVLLAVDASGSMAARKRMSAVKGAVLALLLDAYQRRDKVGLITFRGEGAELVLPPTSSVDIAARRLTDLPHGGRTPLAEGLVEAGRVLALEKLRDPHRRALLVVVTDGRATSGRDADVRARRVADQLRDARIDTVVVDCESGRVRLGMAAALAARLGAQYLRLDEVAAKAIVNVVHEHTRDRGARIDEQRRPGAPGSHVSRKDVA